MNWHPPVPAHVTDAAGTEWSVRRAWPGPLAGDYDMEVQEAPGSGVLAAQLRHGSVDPVPRDDPLMPALAREAAKGELLVHRAHKRAVIHAGNQYIKVFRPGRATEATVRHVLAASVAGRFFATPRIITAGPDVIVFSSLPGRSYYELDQDHAILTNEAFAAIWIQWSHAWAATVSLSSSPLHRPTLERLPEHTAETEAANLQRWIDHWLRHSAGVPEAAPARAALQERAEAAVTALAGTPSDPLVWAHGDLHDKQLLGLGAQAVPGLLDFDESCRAEAALDLANLDVHLELRLRQHLLTTRRYVIAHRSVLATAHELHVSPHRFAAYANCTKLRLACLYSFRPPWGAEASRYLTTAENRRRNKL